MRLSTTNVRVLCVGEPQLRPVEWRHRSVDVDGFVVDVSNTGSAERVCFQRLKGIRFILEFHCPDVVRFIVMLVCVQTVLGGVSLRMRFLAEFLALSGLRARLLKAASLLLLVRCRWCCSLNVHRFVVPEILSLIQVRKLIPMKSMKCYVSLPSILPISSF